MKNGIFFKITLENNIIKLTLSENNICKGSLIFFKDKVYFYTNKNSNKNERRKVKKFLKTYLKLHKKGLLELQKSFRKLKILKIIYTKSNLIILSSEKEKILQFLRNKNTFKNFEKKNY